MSREKKVEKSLDFYQGILSVFLLSLCGMIAYLFVYADNLSRLKIYLLVAGIVAVAMLVTLVFCLCIKYLNELRNSNGKCSCYKCFCSTCGLVCVSGIFCH